MPMPSSIVEFLRCPHNYYTLLVNHLNSYAHYHLTPFQLLCIHHHDYYCDHYYCNLIQIIIMNLPVSII